MLSQAYWSWSLYQKQIEHGGHGCADYCMLPPRPPSDPVVTHAAVCYAFGFLDTVATRPSSFGSLGGRGGSMQLHGCNQAVILRIHGVCYHLLHTLNVLCLYHLQLVSNWCF